MIADSMKDLDDEEISDTEDPDLMVGFCFYIIIEPPRGKTNNVVSEQVRHNPGCTSTEAG